MSRHITRGEGFQGKGTGRVKAWNEPSFDRGEVGRSTIRSGRGCRSSIKSATSERGSVLDGGGVGYRGDFQRLYDSDIVKGDAIQVSRNSNRSA